ncbi:DUF3108 domain-containing protein [Aurantimonas sp. Leaf443]|uniref:DUF3108 domain-containing protein n=1 Tax=Aurantimonas sp. Leaf443 TaxID=1736378 RepID=UPI000700EC01|nr:DUF3108 domain-containing protein [Aurantimonas sp. Leaf443]KQT85856.1 hypothetical protein ASG48_04390 [Aurantimonas sp. Leaf443]
MARKRLLAPALGALLLLAPAGAKAERQTVTTQYGMSVIGLPIGRASFDTVIDGARFQVSGSLSSAGLGALVSQTGGTSKVSGRLTPRGFLADSYGLNYATGEKKWSSDIKFSGGRVVSANVFPRRGKPKPDYVPIARAQLASVVDPLSGLMIRADKPDSVCRRTLRLYDGWSRLDLNLSAQGKRAYKMNGYEGEAHVCNVRIQPVGGYDRSSKGLNYLKGQTIQLWFAPIARPDVYVPVYAMIPTQVGPLTLSATSVAVK